MLVSDSSDPHWSANSCEQPGSETKCRTGSCLFSFQFCQFHWGSIFLKTVFHCLRTSNGNKTQRASLNTDEKSDSSQKMKEKTKSFSVFTLKEELMVQRSTSAMSNFYACKGLTVVCVCTVCVHCVCTVCVCGADFLSIRTPTAMQAFVRQDRNQQSKDLPQQKGASSNPRWKTKETNLSLYLYKITVTVIMLQTIYTSAKQALESHRVQHPNTMVLLMSGKIKNRLVSFSSVLWKA